MDNAEITLGKKQWQVPELASKQNRIIDPLILGLLPIFSEWQADKAAVLSKLGSVEYDNLLKIAYTAITKASPDLKREQFDELPITLPELMAALPVIGKQTGVFSFGSASPGEVGAA